MAAVPAVLVEMLKLRNRSSGLGQFCLHLGRELVAARDPRSRLSFYLPPADAAVFGAVPQRRYSPWHRLLGPPGRDFDVWHATHQDARILPGRRTRLVVTVHDLNFEQKFARQGRGATWRFEQHLRRLRRRLQRASAIVAVSQFTAAALRQRIDLGGIPVQVIHNGLVPLGEAAAPAWAPPSPFVLAIGVLHARKNFHVLPAMLARLPQLRLVIAGQRRDYAAQIEAEIARHGVGDRVLLAGEVSEAEKSWLYRHCEALLVPSLAEGFGLPVLEAMSCGKPVVSSREGSLPEVGGAQAEYWHDFDADAMAAVVQTALATTTASAAAARRAHAAAFSWARAAQQYLDLYASL